MTMAVISVALTIMMAMHAPMVTEMMAVTGRGATAVRSVMTVTTMTL